MAAFAQGLVPFWKEEDGAQPSEYALVFAVVAIALLIIFSPLGSSGSFLHLLDRAAACVLQWRCS